MAFYIVSDLALHTSQTSNTTPNRNWDWSCVDSDYDGAPDAGPQLHGIGKTEIEAIYDYLEQYLERNS